MKTMKSYTDLEQSKVLAEILPHESADMFYRDNGIDVKLMWEHNAHKVESPCWSLAALLSVLGERTSISKAVTDDGKPIYWCWESMYDTDSDDYDNPVDACVEMIIRLHKQKML